MNCKIFTLLSLCFVSYHSHAQELDTSVVFELEKCQQQNLSSWKHPTGAVLEDADAEIKAVFLCKKSYPVFVANFPYDPMSDETSSFFFSLYDKISKANAGWPYSIISDNKFAIHVNPKNTEIDLSYDKLEERNAPWGVNDFQQETKDCFNHPDGSIKLNDEGYVELYIDQFCKNRSKVLPMINDFVSQLIGWKMQFLIFQAGTDANSQSLVLVDIMNHSRVFTLDIEGDAEFGGSEIVYFSPLNRKPKADECESQSADITDWKSNQLGVGIAQQKRFDLLTGKVSDLNNFRCFAVQ